MAIAFDAQSQNSTSGWTNPIGTSYNLAHTISGANRLLLVFLYFDDGTDNISTCTYNGTAMTQHANFQRYDNAQRTYVYYLAAPDTGTNNINITFPSSKDYGMVLGQSYTGVAQSAPEAKTEVRESSGAISGAVTTLTDNAWVVGYMHSDATKSTPASGSTNRAGSTATTLGCDTNAAVTPTGSTTVGWTNTGVHTGAVMSIAPVAATGGTALSSRILMMNLG